jgi:sugar-specific transcriptional regulator TrmB
MEIVDNLKELGLTDGEAKVYVALTELGSSTVGPIVSKSKVAYSNVYEILNRLIEKGLISFIIKEKTKYFQASSPENIKEYLNRKQEEIEDNKKKLKSLISNLERLKEMPPQQEAEVFLGIKGLRLAYEKMLAGMKKNDKHLFFYVHDEEYADDADNFYFSISDLMKKLDIRGVCNEYGRESEFNKKATYMKVRYVRFPIPGNWEANRDMLLIVSWRKPIIGILIKSKSIVDDFKEYFESVWKVAKK